MLPQYPARFSRFALRLLLVALAGLAPFTVLRAADSIASAPPASAATAPAFLPSDEAWAKLPPHPRLFANAARIDALKAQSDEVSRQLLDLLKKYNVAAQMGNQGHSGANYFQFKAWVDAGVIKNVTKITAFMNNPRRWHGMKVEGYLPEQPVPESLDWDCWLATAESHHYNKGYTNGDWRSWYDFGNGALGDWGAHIFDTAHEFLDLGLPTEVEPTLTGHSSLIFPQASTLAFRFPARGTLPPVELTWYDGQENLAPLPDDMGASVVDSDIPPPSKGAAVPATKKRPPGKVIYGEGLTFKGGSHASSLQIIPETKAKDLASTLPHVPASPSNHFANFLKACKGEEKCRSNFAVAGPLCQAMALGVIAQRVNAKLSFDRETNQITNHKLANELLAGAPPRKEWEQYYRLAK
jgi:hypothetical protein